MPRYLPITLLALLFIALISRPATGQPMPPGAYLPMILRAEVTPTLEPTPTSTPTETATSTPVPTDTATPIPTSTATVNPAVCDPSYPTVCIPPPPPDLNCGDISFRRFTVLQPDPHNFDTDFDGIGCESGL